MMMVSFLNLHFSVPWRILTALIVASWLSYTVFISSSKPHYINHDLQNTSSVALSSSSGFQIHHTLTASPSRQTWTKPPNIKVIAMVFFGRTDRCQILNCFLQRNLVDQGGWLDEVHWIRNTQNERDLEYLDSLLSANPRRYKQFPLPQTNTSDQGYNEAWNMLEPGHIYVKIDDDLVWMAEDAIPSIVTTKLEHPEYLLVSANMVNSPLMGWLHYRMGAVHPYLPEFLFSAGDHTSMIAASDQTVSSSSIAGSAAPGHTIQPSSDSLTKVERVPWRYVDHPMWQGPVSFVFPYDQPLPPPPPHISSSLQKSTHRWLRLPETQDSMIRQLRRTPIIASTYDTWGTGLKSWAIAAQHHYSFLENLLNDDLHLYKFAQGAKPWIADYDRLSINFIAINSTEILSYLPVPADLVDEEWLTVTLPQAIGKSVAVDTQALGVHFGFFFQGEISSTDLLGRYLDYAEENVCPKG
jgi:hypothetical protein